jgi:hypothetical protein
LRGWTIQAKEVRGQQIYFLNVSDQTTTVTFCVSNKARTEPCEKKDSSPTRIRVKPNQFIVFDVKKFPQRFFFVESSNPGLAIVAKLALAKGTTRQFSSESSISFGDPSR